MSLKTLLAQIFEKYFAQGILSFYLTSLDKLSKNSFNPFSARKLHKEFSLT